MFTPVALLALAIGANAGYFDKRQTLTTFVVTSTVLPDYFQTNPELFPGMPFDIILENNADK